MYVFIHKVIDLSQCVCREYEKNSRHEGRTVSVLTEGTTQGECSWGRQNVKEMREAGKKILSMLTHRGQEYVCTQGKTTQTRTDTEYKEEREEGSTPMVCAR